MKTKYTDEELQKAIDEAFPLGARKDGCALDTVKETAITWQDEAPNRLKIAKAFLERLQHDPYAELKKAHAEGRAIEYTDDSSWSGEWQHCPEPLWITSDDCRVNARYRIKPEDPRLLRVWDDFDKTAGVDFDGAAPWTPTIGDVVQLKSGGPKMTIHFLDTKNAGCVTFSKSSEFTFATLPKACLIPVTTDNSSKVKS